MRKILGQATDRFNDDDSGAATIESLLWIPMFVFILVLITDVSFILFGRVLINKDEYFDAPPDVSWGFTLAAATLRKNGSRNPRGGRCRLTT